MPPRKRPAQYVPNNDKEQYLRDNGPKLRPGEAGISNYRVSQPSRIHARSETPFLPYQPSTNFNMLPYQGWDSSHLNTYLIPDAQKNQLNLFNRYILKGEHLDKYSGRPNAATLISDRIQKLTQQQGIERGKILAREKVVKEETSKIEAEAKEAQRREAEKEERQWYNIIYGGAKF